MKHSARRTPGFGISYGAAAVLVVFAALWTSSAPAHEIRPGLLELVEREPGRFDVTWKVPMRGDRVLALRPLLPASLTPVAPPTMRRVPGALVEHTTYRSDGAPIVGATIAIEGLRALQTDVLVRVALVDGATHSTILRPKSPSWVIPARAGKLEVARSYGQMGTLHILGGVDHLLFVLALFLIVPGAWMLVKTITAFTVAHSLSLALAALGVVHFPPKPTEAVIALSILFLAAEVVHAREGRASLTERHPWAIAFGFGLFHGLGFAGALREIGLPEHEVPLALFAFNVGVEAGQILFLAGVALAAGALRRAPIAWPAGSWRFAPYAIGSAAAFWTFQRVGAFL